MPFGVTTTGFVGKTVTDLKADLEAAWRSVFGSSVNVDDRSRNGQMIGNLADTLADVWQLGEAIASAFSQPTGVLLDYISKLTGTVRLAASYSSVTLTLTGTAGTVVASGKVASVSGTSAQFQTTASATIAAATAWATSTVYSVGNRRKANGNVYQCITAGTSANAGSGPSSTAADITDGTAHWRYLGAGAAVVDVAARATVTGPVQGYSGTVSIISTPVSGWSGVINVLDATPGGVLETDSALRIRRAVEVAGQGSSPLPALRAQLLKVSGVTAVTIFENTSDVTVGTIDPHGIECIVEGSTDQAVIDSIFAGKSGGIATSGNTSGTAVDSLGTSHAIKFTRPSDLNCYVSLSLQYDPLTYPADGDDQVREAVVAIGDLLPTGRDAYNMALAAGALNVPGVLNITAAYIGTVHPPVSSSVSVSVRQHAKFDTSRVDVASSIGSV